MLIGIPEVLEVLQTIPIRGVLHIGAHDCEEMPFYTGTLRLPASSVHWVEAIPIKVVNAINRGIPNVHQAIIAEKDDEPVVFHISNNFQSSSILPMKMHRTEHPNIWYVDQFESKSITIDTFLEKNKIDPHTINFWNLDIQGSELLALRGASRSLVHVDVLYLEVNIKELYEGCGLMQDLDVFLAPYHFQRVLTKMTKHGWGDAVYIKKTSC